MAKSKKFKQETSLNAKPVTANHDGIVKQRNPAPGRRTGPMPAGRNSMQKASLANAPQGDASIGQEFMISKSNSKISIILIIILSFFRNPFGMLKQCLMILFGPLINRILNHLEGQMAKKSQKKYSFFRRFVNIYGTWDRSQFDTNFISRTELYIPVTYKYFKRYSKFPTTSRYFVLMGTPSTGNVMIVVPLLPGTIVGDISLMHTIFNACATADLSTFPVGFITAIQARLVLTDTAQTKVKSLGAGQRDEALKLSYDDLRQLVIYVQDAVNLTPLNAFSITESCHMHLRGTGGQHASSFGVENGALAGTVIFAAAGAGPHTAHLWWVSFDNQVTWVFLDVSMWKDMTRNGFTSGAVLWFDHQVVNSTGRLALDGPKKLRIN